MASTITYWIQKADFSAQEHGSVTLDEAINAVLHHDWKSELTLRSAMAAAGNEVCDPGIGFVTSDQRILHICPIDDQTAFFHYHFDGVRKILRLIPIRRRMTSSNMRIDRTMLAQVVESFFCGNHEWLLAHSSIVD